jgi:hypothetical protein
MEAIEQVQVSIAPYDIAQGNFVGASVDTVTRSGTNSLRGSAYYRFRNDSVRRHRGPRQALQPGTFDTKQTGGWVGCADRQEQAVRVRQLRERKGRAPALSPRAPTTAASRSAATSPRARLGRVATSARS